ncbi:SCO1860 family LAETG-anchored protein [Streptomyces sp. KR80]|uniref:SCO1860 family LAETG-anchored protein n=1 Tax=Streptomyces sp. KR80 TaxID=3457426 RepID=UPI003FD1D4D1
MYTHVFGVPARPAVLLGAAALVAGGALTAGPAYATPSERSGATGKATAVAARANLDVSVNGVGNVPVTAALNDVTAPGDAERTLLTAEVSGTNKGQPLTLVKAEVARASAKANAHRSVGDVKLVGVRAYAPGLPASPLLSADVLKATASCVKGNKPLAKAALTDNVAVFGKPVAVDRPGNQHVEVPGVGTVDLVLEHATTTDSTGAATALRLTYTVNPTAVGVVKASGEIVLAEATCTMPGGSGTNGGSSSGGSDGGATDGQTSGGSAGSNGAEGGDSAGDGPETQTGDGGKDLAATGSSSATPVIAGVGGALVVFGGAAMYLIRRRRSTAQDS